MVGLGRILVRCALWRVCRLRSAALFQEACGSLTTVRDIFAARQCVCCAGRIMSIKHGPAACHQDGAIHQASPIMFLRLTCPTMICGRAEP